MVCSPRPFKEWAVSVDVYPDLSGLRPLVAPGPSSPVLGPTFLNAEITRDLQGQQRQQFGYVSRDLDSRNGFPGEFPCKPT